MLKKVLNKNVHRQFLPLVIGILNDKSTLPGNTLLKPTFKNLVILLFEIKSKNQEEILKGKEVSVTESLWSRGWGGMDGAVGVRGPSRERRQ